MLKYNITPIVTLYHLDLPQKLQELGGFANPMIKDWFEDYARVAFEHFGDRVKYWITFNEPVFCSHGYGSDKLAPIVNSTAFGGYLCAKNVILAHANAYHTYKNDFKPTQRGQCGITIGVNWYEPLTDTPEDRFAAEIKRQGDVSKLIFVHFVRLSHSFLQLLRCCFYFSGACTLNLCSLLKEAFLKNFLRG